MTFPVSVNLRFLMNFRDELFPFLMQRLLIKDFPLLVRETSNKNFKTFLHYRSSKTIKNKKL